MKHLEYLFSTLAITFGLMLPVLVFLGAVLAWKVYAIRRQKKRGVRHPLSQDLLRPAGYSTHQKVQALNDKVDESFTQLMVLPFLLPTVGFVNVIQGGAINKFALVLTAVLVTLLMGGTTIRLVRTINKRASYKMGWEGEVAAAEELNRLMLEGHVVFHDVPAEGFNIDHVIVGKDAVYAAETKLRTKRRSDDGDAFRVTFDGETLDFNGYRSADSLNQARRQAKWLSGFLTRSTGDKVAAIPLVLVPGWFVDRTGRSDVHVLNPKQVRQLVGKSGQMAEDARRRVVHQLDQLCRGVPLSEIIR